MKSIGESLVTAFDYAWSRFTERLEGLTDEEYFWEPVPGCWSLRAGDDGTWRLDGGGGGGPAPNPVPVTTIAWRVGHLAALAVGGFADRRFGSGDDVGGELRMAGDVESLPEFLELNYATWRDGLVSLDEAGFGAPLGPAWGPFAEANTVDLALHVFDEVVHHAAEVGLLRDLFQNRASLGG